MHDTLEDQLIDAETELRGIGMLNLADAVAESRAKLRAAEMFTGVAERASVDALRACGAV